jgi:hypothetical protein
MVDSAKTHDQPATPPRHDTSASIDSGSSLLPMLIGGLAFITIGMIVIMLMD